ncbi:MAG: excinuclease ABC subunit UvrA [Lachnospiraceae bacterium]|nr:excinuclease ABC subunit UvrA [Lachnospiraceae bacterium]
MNKNIEIKNARIHNLKGIDVSIPKHKLTVITGVSGSGKSSLAFDTLYEEGKRRYLMFSGTEFMVDSVQSFDSITGLSPTVAVEQRIIRQSNPRSTVGTKIKISAMLAALFANYGSCLPEYDDGQPLEVSMFQKNSAKGMCVKCLGKGVVKWIDADKMFEDKSQHIYDIACGLGKRGSTRNMLEIFCKNYGMNLWEDTLSDLTDEQIDLLKYGDGGKSKFYGFIPWITLLTSGAVSTSGRLASILKDEGMIEERKCIKCGGTGLGEKASHITFGDKTINDLEHMYISDLLNFLNENNDGKNPLLKEIITKLSCMVDVGLHHLSLSRPVPTLSGGEIQRLFLASYIIAEMDSIIFVFDEPTIGLHEIEKENLIRIIRRLVDNGNTVVVVEHDEHFIRVADYIIDIGPKAGIYGGYKVFEGDYDLFLKCTDSKTASYLNDRSGFKIKREYRRSIDQKMLTLSGARLHNLKNVTVSIPLGVMVGVAGVSGSGKSSLIADTLVPKLKEQLKSKCIMDEDEEDSDGTEENMNKEVTLTGVSNIKHCYIIDQRPIGRSRTSCPATYTGIFDHVRNLFAQSDKAKERGYTAGMFSVNSKGGCHKCKGDGVIHYHVGFGNFIDIGCDACGGSGYIREAMEITVGGKNIRDILEMSVDEARDFFSDKDEMIYKMLAILQRVGMGYIKLGQATPTISGGESQRIKLAKELAKGKNNKNVLYILDEPTTGLSFSDSEQLMSLLNELVDMGNSIIITEHDSYVLSNCDYIIELGEGGGNAGGNIIATGTPAELKNNPVSIIGRYLK